MSTSDIDSIKVSFRNVIVAMWVGASALVGGAFYIGGELKGVQDQLTYHGAALTDLKSGQQDLTSKVASLQHQFDITDKREIKNGN